MKNIFAVALFTIVAITVGVLTVYFTSSTPSMFESKVDFNFPTYLLSVLENCNFSIKYFQKLI
jgi:hypothetical protein